MRAMSSLGKEKQGKGSDFGMVQLGQHYIKFFFFFFFKYILEFVQYHRQRGIREISQFKYWTTATHEEAEQSPRATKYPTFS